MRTIQVTIDAPLLTEVDKVVGELDTTRSAFLREALQQALRRHRIQGMEKEHERGYTEQTAEMDEFGWLMDQQTWSEP